MASIQRKGDSYYCQFYHLGRRHTVTIGAVTPTEAEAFAGKVDYLLLRLRQRLIQIPPGVSIVDFVNHDGHVPEVIASAPMRISFAELKSQYLQTHRIGALEDNTLLTLEVHLNHLQKTLGPNFPLPELRLGDLQRHVNRRANCRGLRGRRLSPDTLKKEIASFRAAWNWAERTGLVTGRFPNSGLVYPKSDEKPPFQSMAEIERRVARSQLTKAEIASFWECLFLTGSEVEELLDHVSEKASHAWLYPMVAFAAHTGARRSEMLRAQVGDVDMNGMTVLIREKKRNSGKRTTRRVPISDRLALALRDWIGVHPGGSDLFSWAARSSGSARSDATRNKDFARAVSTAMDLPHGQSLPFMRQSKKMCLAQSLFFQGLAEPGSCELPIPIGHGPRNPSNFPGFLDGQASEQMQVGNSCRSLIFIGKPAK